MSGNTEESRNEGEGTPGTPENNIGKAISFQERGGKPGGGKGILIQNEKTGALNVQCGQSVCYSTQASGDRDNPSQSYLEEKAYTIPSNPMSDRGQAVCYGVDPHNVSVSKEKTMTMLQGKDDNHNVPCVYGLDRASFNQGKNAKYDFAVEEEIAQPLVARGPGGVMTP